MRLALMVTSYSTLLGGTERLCADLARALLQRGHDVIVLTTDLGRSHPQGLFFATPLPAGEQVENGVHVMRLPYVAQLARSAGWIGGPIPGRNHLRRWLRARARARFAGDAIAFARQWRPDALLTMRAWDLPPTAGAKVRTALGTPVVYSPQMHPDTEGWKEAPVRRLVARSDAVAANTGHEARLLVERYGARPERVVVTGCGAEPAPSTGPWPRQPHVLYFGRKALEKGLLLLIDAMERVWDAQPTARLVLAGGRHGRDAPAIAARIAALPAARQAQVEQPDNVSDEQRDHLMAAARCLCLPSEHESFGIVLLEAWAHGTPVVALDLPVMGSTVEQDRTGLLARKRDPDDLARQLLRLLQDADLARRLGDAGALKLRTAHTWEHVAERYERAFELARRR